MSSAPELATERILETPALQPAVAGRPQRHVGLRAFVETVSTGGFIKVCGLVQGIVISRLLGPLGRGYLEIAVLWPTLFAALGMFGVNMAIKRRAAREPDLGILTRTAMLMSLGLSAITVVVSYLLLPYFIPAGQRQILPCAVLFLAFIPANHLFLSLQAVDEGTGHFRRYNLIRAVLNPVYLAAIAIVWLAGLRGVWWFVVGLLAANFVVVAIRIVVAVRSVDVIGPIRSPGRILREGCPFWLAHVCDLAYENADRILLIWLLGPRAVGLYVVALAAGSLLGSVGVSANTVVFTIAAQSSSRAGFSRSARIFRVTALMWLFAGSAMAALVPWLLPIIYGSRFADAVLPAVILIAGSALAMQARLLDHCLRGQGRPLPGVATRVAAMVVLVVLGVAMYGKWGLLGVTCAFVAAQGIYLCLLGATVGARYGGKAVLELLPRADDVREAVTRIKRYFASRYASEPRCEGGYEDD
ncbi:MAG: oligosaccharide flippase family protein [Planctomycetota bacterium]|nr:oligosaccharide flippase family protein [Planctomycetota bacterium]